MILHSTSANTFHDTTNDKFITTSVESFYLQDDFRVTRDLQLNLGVRWDFQQLNAGTATYLSLNNFKENLEPRLGLTWDFTGKGRGKLFAHFARFLEAPIPVMFLFTAGGSLPLSPRTLIG